MNKIRTDVAELFEKLRRKSPAYLDLITAETDEQFEAAFTTLLESAVSQLERNVKNFHCLDEVGLTGVLAAALTMPGLTVTTEANSNGHVDLTIDADHCTPARRKLGEAKIYRGSSYHIGGIRQLVGRYTTGRELSGLIIFYVRRKNIRGISERLRVELNKTLPERQIGACKSHRLKWSFVTSHIHDSGERIRVDHIGCNLCP